MFRLLDSQMRFRSYNVSNYYLDICHCELRAHHLACDIGTDQIGDKMLRQ